MEETQAPTTVDELAGVPEGTVIKTAKGMPNEVVVGDYDEDGVLIGWHKELAEN